MYWSKLTRLFRPNRNVTKRCAGSLNSSHGAARFLSTANVAPTPDEKSTDPPRARIDLDFLIKNSDLPHWVHSPIDFDLYKAKDLEQLLAVVDRYRLDGIQASAFFARLAKFTPTNTLKLALDSRFKYCFEVFVREAEAMPLSQIFVVLRSLLLIGFQSDHTLCLRIQEIIEHRLKKDPSLPLSALVSFACFHIDYDTVDDSGRKSAFQKSLENLLTSKLPYIHDLNNILLMMKKLSKNNEDNQQEEQTIKVGRSLLQACEYRIVDLLDTAKAEDLANILIYEAAAKSRNLVLIKTVVQKLDALVDPLGMKRAISVLGALNSLNYYTKSFISKIFGELNVALAAEHLKKPSDFRFLCTQIAVGRFRDEGLITKLTNWLLKNMDICEADDLIAYVSMCAKCNVEKLPDDLIANIKKKVQDSDSSIDKHTLLKYVWSLAVLKKLDAALGNKVLEDDFVDSLLRQSSDHKNTIIRLNILNICASMKNDLKIDSFKDYGSLESFTADLKIVPRKTKITAVKVFLESLYLLAPKETYVQTSSISPFGYLLDAIIYLSKDNKPIPLAEKDQNPGAVPTAFMVLDRGDYTQLSHGLTGLNVMAVRHLTSSGHRVILVPVADITRQATVIDRVNYLKLLIENYSTSDLDALESRS